MIEKDIEKKSDAEADENGDKEDETCVDYEFELRKQSIRKISLIKKNS